MHSRASMWKQASVFALLAIGGAACGDTEPAVGPLLPPEPPDNPEIVSAAWIADVDKVSGTIKITPPQNGYDINQSILADFFGLEAGHPDLSILAGDVVDVVADNSTLAFSSVGQFSPGLIRVTFDVAIRNKLSAVDLIQPTFPTPPPGSTGVLLFPFETVVTTTSGQVTGQQGDGTGVIVELPNQGNVAPSVDFDGAPFNFFNDTACGPTDNDCYRYEEYAAPLQGGAQTAFRTVGFDAESTVSQFRARMIVAADLLDSTPNTPPVASAGGPYTGQTGSPVAFDASASNDPDGSIVQYDWDFGDGTVVTNAGATPSHTYAAAGTFTASVTVTDNRGATNTATAQVTITQPANQAPTANPGGPYTGAAGSAIAFDGSASNDPDGSIASYAWDFGDGNTGTGVAPSHTYAAAGTYTVSLVVTDNLGLASVAATTTATIGAAANAFAVWTDGAGNAISSIASGGTATLQICTSVADINAFQAQVQYNGAIAAAAGGGSDLNSVTNGVGACAGTGTDVVDQYTGATAGANQVNALNFSISGTPGTGVQGLASIPFNATAAGSLQPTIVVDVATDFGGNPVTLSFSVPALTIN